METERIALSLRVRPGEERTLARLLTAAPVDDRDGGRAPAPPARPVATFLAPGRVVHLTERPGRGRSTAPAGAPDRDAELRHLCEVPEGLPTATFLARACLDRRAHYRRPEPPGKDLQRRALLYPVRPGHGEELCRLLSAGVAPRTPQRLASALVSSTVYAREDTVVRYWEATASAEEELDNIARVVPRSPLGAALNRLLSFPADLTTAEGFRAFFTTCAMNPHPVDPRLGDGDGDGDGDQEGRFRAVT